MQVHFMPSTLIIYKNSLTTLTSWREYPNEKQPHGVISSNTVVAAAQLATNQILGGILWILGHSQKNENTHLIDQNFLRTLETVVFYFQGCTSLAKKGHILNHIKSILRSKSDIKFVCMIQHFYKSILLPHKKAYSQSLVFKIEMQIEENNIISQ